MWANGIPHVEITNTTLAGNNLQTDANAAPSCNVPVGKPGGLNTPGVFPKLAGTTPQPQFLAFQYLVPALGGDAAGAGNGTTCLNAPVNAKDILDNARTEVCTIGAAEAK